MINVIRLFRVALIMPFSFVYTEIMALSEELRRRAEAVEENPNYRGRDLSQKVIIGLVGPFGTGKSTITAEVIRTLETRDIKAGIIGSEMTREHRPDDPAEYRTELDPLLLIERGEQGELINLTPFPTGNLYATSADSIPHEVNIGPLMPDSLQKFRDAGCKAVHAFYLTTLPEQWQKQLDKDQRLSRPDAAQRITDAVDSLEYAIHKIQNPGDMPLILINNDGTRPPNELAHDLLSRAGYQQDEEECPKPLPHYAREMYDYVRSLKPQTNEVA